MLPELEQALKRLDLVYLEHSGRSSGQTYNTELSFAYDGEAIYLLARTHVGELPDWLRNLLAAGKAEFFAGVRRLRGRPELLEECAVARVADMFRVKYGVEVVRKWYEDAPHVAVRLSNPELVDPA